MFTYYTLIYDYHDLCYRIRLNFLESEALSNVKNVTGLDVFPKKTKPQNTSHSQSKDPEDIKAEIWAK